MSTPIQKYAFSQRDIPIQCDSFELINASGMLGP